MQNGENVNPQHGEEILGQTQSGVVTSSLQVYSLEPEEVPRTVAPRSVPTSEQLGDGDGLAAAATLAGFPATHDVPDNRPSPPRSSAAWLPLSTETSIPPQYDERDASSAPVDSSGASSLAP